MPSPRPPSRCRLVDAPRLPVYDLGTNHPFARDRQLALYDLLRRQHLVDDDELLVPAPADDALLRLAHAPEYVDVVRAISQEAPSRALLSAALAAGLGTSDNPIAPGQHDAARAVVGATVACVAEVMEGRARHAFNPAGGLHHAMPALASGFCIYNDLVAGIRRARALGAARVLYVDYDVHHGDGVEHAFAEDATVMTISLHETPEVRWPGTGRITDLGRGAARGTAINVPLASGTGDASWLEAVRAVVVPMARRFRPDLIVSQHGCDPHRDDPLAELQLTTGAMIEAARITKHLADEVCDGRWVATGGGGYQPVRVIPRVWGGVWAVMSGRAVPERVDPGWREAWQHRAASPLPETFLDPPHENGFEEHAAQQNRATVQRLLALLG